jgi:hypothetical protein
MVNLKTKNSDRSFPKAFIMTKIAQLPLLKPSFRAHRLTWLSGSHEDLKSEYQLLLIIQPNCPGCIINAIPVANAIVNSTKDFDVYCVSTAFEDFDINNSESAMALLDGSLSGMSAALLGDNSEPCSIPQIPFAHDYMKNREEADEDLKDWALSVMLESARNQLRSLNYTEEKIDRKLENIEYNALPDQLGELFWSVKALGTPTWVVHKYNGEIIDVCFGVMDLKKILHWVEKYIPASFNIPQFRDSS